MIKLIMKKITAMLSTLGSLVLATKVSAQTPTSVAPTIPLQIKQPINSGIIAGTELTTIISNALRIVFVVASLMVLVMLIWGAFQWIVSGGEKEAVGNARNRITNGLIGLAILALAFLIVTIVGQIVGIDILNIKGIPSLSSPTT